MRDVLAKNPDIMKDIEEQVEKEMKVKMKNKSKLDSELDLQTASFLPPKPREEENALKDGPQLTLFTTE